MKKVLMLVVFAFGTSTDAFSQAEDFVPFSKGTKLVGFSLASNTTKSESSLFTSKTSTTLLTGQFGYFILNNLVIGLDVTSIVQESKFDTEKSSGSQTEAGIFAAYYFRVGKKAAIVPELRVVSGKQIQEYPFSSGKDETTIKGNSIGVGYSYMINQFVGFDIKYRFGKATYSTDGIPDLEFENADLLFGFQLYF